MSLKLRLLVALGVTLLTSAHGQSFLTNGLLGHWPFNGTANDVAGTNHGVVYGAIPTTNRFGQQNSAYLFDGATAYIQTIKPMQDLSSGTISLWFNARGLSSQLTLLSDSTTAAGYDWSIQIVPDGNLTVIGMGPGKVVGSTGIQITNGVGRFTQPISNTWVHLVWIMQPTNQTVFINGDLVKTENSKSGNLGYHNAGLVFGADSAGNPYSKRFNGILSDVRIYNRPLSPTEVRRLFSIESGLLFVGKAIYLEQGGLTVGSTYQLQSSTDLSLWTNYGSPFVATNSYWRPPNYWDVDQWTKLFFRLVPQ